MHIVLTILIGGFTGLILRVIAPGRLPRTAIASAAIGVVGAIIADYAIYQVECCAQNGPVDLIGAAVGALLLLTLDRSGRGKPQ